MTEAVDTENAFDIAILGCGPVGLTLACALAETRWRIALIERRARNDPAASADPRALAIAHGGRQLLERLNAWDAGAATAIREIHVSQRGGFGHTLIRAEDENLPALGYVMPYRALTSALDRTLTAARKCTHDGAAPAENLAQRIECFNACTVERIDEAADAGMTHLQLTLTPGGERDDARRIRTRLVVHAEGTPTDVTDGDKAPGEARPRMFMCDYRQHAIVAQVHPAQKHDGRAWERFTPEGPVALLPLGETYALVMTTPSAQSEALLRLDDAAFLTMLRERFVARLDFVSAEPRTAFPLVLRLRTSPVAARQVWIGNSAQTLHPASGQGLNLGLRDAWTLAETLMNATHHAAHVDDDPGNADTLAAYARRRRLDRLAGAAFTDGIVRIFSNDLPPLRALCGLGLLALAIAPPLRHALTHHMIWGTRGCP